MPGHPHLGAVQVLGTLAHLHTASLELGQRALWVLGAPAQTGSAGKSPARSRLPLFQSDGGQCALGNLQRSRTVFGLLQIFVWKQSCLWALEPVLHTSRFGFYSCCQLRASLVCFSLSNPVSGFDSRWRRKVQQHLKDKWKQTPEDVSSQNFYFFIFQNMSTFLYLFPPKT